MLDLYAFDCIMLTPAEKASQLQRKGYESDGYLKGQTIIDFLGRLPVWSQFCL